MQVAVFGPRNCTDTDTANARTVGTLLTEAVAPVLCGGGRGVMAVVAEGASAAGGLVIGVRPDTDPAGTCDGLSAVPYTNMGEASVAWMSFAITFVPGADGQPDYLLAVGADVTELHERHEELHRQARHDPLTGLHNRRLLLEKVDELIANAHPHDGAGFCFADLDHFKTINDRYGHNIGDKALAAVAVRLFNSVREHGCLIARIGGDEFIAHSQHRLRHHRRGPVAVGTGRPHHHRQPRPADIGQHRRHRDTHPRRRQPLLRQNQRQRTLGPTHPRRRPPNTRPPVAIPRIGCPEPALGNWSHPSPHPLVAFSRCWVVPERLSTIRSVLGLRYCPTGSHAGSEPSLVRASGEARSRLGSVGSGVRRIAGCRPYGPEGAGRCLGHVALARVNPCPPMVRSHSWVSGRSPEGRWKEHRDRAFWNVHPAPRNVSLRRVRCTGSGAGRPIRVGLAIRCPCAAPGASDCTRHWLQ
ncbi:diguanylate cyclase domain-containing protein [Nocardia sp. CA-107356]|uniref:diguanylate cyclase domain-containing protein n=1 Tax=Nocardia sp. CA-107356 TaxID=3239972 RepID=UPI003D93D1C0